MQVGGERGDWQGLNKSRTIGIQIDMKVLISDKTDPICGKTLRSYSGIDVEERGGMSPEELLQEIPGYEALIVRSATKVTAQVIEAGTRLKAIGRAGAGVDNIDVQAATEKGILVMNTPGGNANAVAELAVGMMFALTRKLYTMAAGMQAERWEKKGYRGGELAGKTLGLVGIGQVGARVARKALALDMKVLAYDPLVSPEKAREMGVEHCDIERLYERCDFLSLHLPRNEQTAGMINAEAFSKMKPGVFLINCARGGIVVESDLLDALEKGQVAGAGIDVYETEPPEDWSLAKHPAVIATPHIGAATAEAQIVVADMIGRQIGHYLTEGKPIHAVNQP
jgi:D-3-phosphoglycerate dehydrogenase